MLRKLYIFKSHITIGFLVSFSCVFICNFLCDVGVIEFNMAHVSSHKAEVPSTFVIHSHQDSDSDNHHQKHDHSSNLTDHQDLPNDTNNHEEDGCCEDLANAFYTSLIKSEVQTISINAKLYVLHLIGHNVDQAFTQYARYKKPIFLYDIPPPPGREIRILFQSFLN